MKFERYIKILYLEGSEHPLLLPAAKVMIDVGKGMMWMIT